MQKMCIRDRHQAEHRADQRPDNGIAISDPDGIVVKRHLKRFQRKLLWPQFDSSLIHRITAAEGQNKLLPKRVESHTQYKDHKYDIDCIKNVFSD